MDNFHSINTLLKNHLLDTVFPTLFPKFNKMLSRYSAYMVVIGGVSVEMCAKLDNAASSFLHNVFSDDVDIKIVIEDDNANNNDIHEIRLSFISKVIAELQKFVSKHRLGVDVFTDTSLLDHKVEAVKNARVVSIAIANTEESASLVDTTFFSKQSTHHYHVYKSIMHSKHHVPYYLANKVAYATCDYMMFDTCRMLVDRANYLKETRSLFALMKFTKYVVKFMSLYVLRKKIKTLPSYLSVIYNEAYTTLRKINMIKLRKNFKHTKPIKYDLAIVEKHISYLDNILKASNMRRLIKAATH